MYYIVIAIAAALLFFLLLPVRIILEYSESAQLYLKILFFKKPLKGKKKKPHKRKKESPDNEEKKPRDTHGTLNRFLVLRGDITEFASFIAKRCVTFEKLDFSLYFSTGDAAVTGILTGVINTAVYSVLGVIHNHTTLMSYSVTVQPEFETEKLSIHLLCIARTRAVHIIGMVVKGFFLYGKFKKQKQAED